MKKLFAVAVAVVGVSVASMALGRGDGHAHQGKRAEAPGLTQLKKLAGTWVRLDEQGKPTEEVISEVRVTAGGSAVLDIVFPGTEKEMVTVYHQDGDTLMLTHYCMLGNQPRMIAREVTDGKIVFECDGKGTSLEETDQHMHQATITWHGRDRITTEWRLHDKGENTYTAAFELARRVDRAAAAR